MSDILEIDRRRDGMRARMAAGEALTLDEVLDLHQAYVGHGAGAPPDIEEAGLRIVLRDHSPDDIGSMRRLCEVLRLQGKAVPTDLAMRCGEAASTPASDGLDQTAVELAWAARHVDPGLTSALNLTPPTPLAATPSAAVGRLEPELRRLVEESLAGRPECVRVVVDRLGGRPPSELSATQVDELVVATALSRGLPIDLLDLVVTAGRDLTAEGPYHALWSATFRRVVHWHDVCRLLALYRRRDFEWSMEGSDPVVEAAALGLTDDNYAELPPLFDAAQARELVEYFRDRPGYAAHVPDGASDTVRRYVGYGAEEAPFCSYPQCDIVLAPHILEAVLTPRLAEIGRRYFGAVPRLSKLYAHWDLPGAKKLGSGTSISHLHRDLNDFGMMWLYVYLTDVDLDCGPHALVPGTHALPRMLDYLDDARRRNIRLRHMDRDLNALDLFDGYGYQIDDGLKEEIFAPARKVFVGSAGTSFLSGGLNLHQIVNPQTKPRLMLAARFTLNPFTASASHRDCDPIPRRIVERRVGDSELVQEMTRTAVDWRRAAGG